MLRPKRLRTGQRRDMEAPGAPIRNEELGEREPQMTQMSADLIKEGGHPCLSRRRAVRSIAKHGRPSAKVGLPRRKAGPPLP